MHTWGGANRTCYTTMEPHGSTNHAYLPNGCNLSSPIKQMLSHWVPKPHSKGVVTLHITLKPHMRVEY